MATKRRGRRGVWRVRRFPCRCRSAGDEQIASELATRSIDRGCGRCWLRVEAVAASMTRRRVELGCREVPAMVRRLGRGEPPSTRSRSGAHVQGADGKPKVLASGAATQRSWRGARRPPCRELDCPEVADDRGRPGATQRSGGAKIAPISSPTSSPAGRPASSAATASAEVMRPSASMVSRPLLIVRDSVSCSSAK